MPPSRAHALALALALAGASASGAARAADAPTVEGAPNIYGQTGVVRTTSAHAGGNLVFDVGASGFFAFAPDFIVDGNDDADILTGGQLAASAAFLDVIELSLALRAASNSNAKLPPSQFSVGDLYPSLKLGYALGPVAFGADLRGHLPTAVDAAGYDLANWAVTAQGLFTLDLKFVRAHLNGGYVYQQGKSLQGNGRFELNPNFYVGADGALLALAADAWFYDQAVGGLSIEVPLPYVLPFVEVWYQTAVGVLGADRGAGGLAPYDFVNDAHLTVTPGARVTLGGGFTLDLAVDVGVLGTGGGGTDIKKVVAGVPLNPVWLARVGLTSTFDPFRTSSGGGGGGGGPPTGQIKACVADDAGRPIQNALVAGEPLGATRIATDDGGCFLTPALALGKADLTVAKQGYEPGAVSAVVEAGKTAEVSVKLKTVPGAITGAARVLGYVTNKEDETLEADLELWDRAGVKPAGKALGGSFDLQAAPGNVIVVAKADGYLAQGSGLYLEAGGRGRTTITLKKTPKIRKAVLEGTKIAIQGKVPFEFKKPRLQSTAEYLLDDIVDVLLRQPSLRVRVEVYAEALATPDESQKLADDRAATVVDYLTSHGVWPSRLEQKGIPLGAAENEKSRRVDLVVLP